MKIKTGDKVKILSGKDKGKTGQVSQVFVKEQRAVVAGLNLAIKHQRGKKQGQGGQRIQFPAPIKIHKLSLVCPKCGVAARVGYKITVSEGAKAEGGAKKIKTRVCRKCQEAI